MPIVPTLSDCSDGHPSVLRRVGLGIVRTGSPEMSSTIDQPGEVQHNHIAKSTSNPEASPEALSPVEREESWEDEAHEQGEPWVKFLLEHDDGIVVEVVEVYFLARLSDLLGFLHIKPAHVCKEKTS